MAVLVIFCFIFGLIASCSCNGAIGSLNDNQLKALIAEKKNVVALFCQSKVSSECMQKSQEINRALENSMASDITAAVALDSAIPQRYGLKATPLLMLYREQKPLLYYAQHDPEGDLGDWLDRSMQLATRELNEDSFEHDTQAATGATTGDWFVMFYNQKDCAELVPTWEALAVWLKQKLNVATVDTGRNPALAERFQIKQCPTLILFHHGAMYTYDLSLRDINSLTNFAEGWYKNVAAVKVPVEPTPFDKLTDDIVTYLKSLDQYTFHLVTTLLGLAGVGAAVMSLLLCYLRGKRKQDKKRE